LLWLGLQNAEQEQRTQMASDWGQSQASALKQALRQLQGDTQAVTERLMLVEALRGDGERRRDAEQRLLDLPGVVDAHLNVRGRAVPDTSRPGPLNFAAQGDGAVQQPAVVDLVRFGGGRLAGFRTLQQIERGEVQR
ncbi:hypothetical protein QM285_22160, partial [Stutzerimonas stutzeri]|nr:hypothetical protein [Stutzerimonas stutzeri]